MARDPDGVLQIAQKLGDVCRQIESFPEARRWYSLVADIQPHNTDAVLGLALCLRGEGKYGAAVRRFRDCLKVYTRRHDNEARAYVHWAIGTTQRFAENLLDAEKNLRQSLSLAKKLGDKSAEAYARAGLGGTLRMLRRPKESGQEYLLANRIFRRERDRFGLAYSFCGRGNALRMQNQFHRALSFMKKAIALYDTLGLKGPRAYVLWSLSQAELGLRRVQDAHRHLKQAEKLFISVKDKRGLKYVRWGRAIYQRVLKSPSLQPPQIP